MRRQNLGTEGQHTGRSLKNPCAYVGLAAEAYSVIFQTRLSVHTNIASPDTAGVP